VTCKWRDKIAKLITFFEALKRITKKMNTRDEGVYLQINGIPQQRRKQKLATKQSKPSQGNTKEIQPEWFKYAQI
jgi:hypothetical protein